MIIYWNGYTEHDTISELKFEEPSLFLKNFKLDTSNIDNPGEVNFNLCPAFTNFNKNLYRDLTDVYGKNNSQRQFYTTPITTVPNDQNSFANWLYRSEKTCKEGDGNRCSANNYGSLNNERMIV